MTALGGTAVEIDYAPFAEAAGFLYQPAGTAERMAAIEGFFAAHVEDMHPVTRAIIARGREASAMDVYRMHYRLQELRRQTVPVWQEIDVMLVPTSGTIYRTEEVLADPVQLNSNLGHYTNFVNYFDLSALAVPNGFQPDGLPAGITLIGPTFAEPLLAGIGQAFHAATGLTLGASGHAQPDAKPAAGLQYPRLELMVFGAHLSGEPLNPQLRALGARFVRSCRTAADYRLYALKGAIARPGLVRVDQGGAAIEGEIWALDPAAFGVFVAEIPAPLGIADVRLEDGGVVKGFVCEAAGIAGAAEITDFGGWRAFRRASAA
jgi:allophanate hydrolase